MSSMTVEFCRAVRVMRYFSKFGTIDISHEKPTVKIFEHELKHVLLKDDMYYPSTRRYYGASLLTALHLSHCTVGCHPDVDQQ